MPALNGVLLEEDMELTLGELCRACCIHADWLIDMVDEGIVEPRGHGQTEWRFSGVQLVRVRTVIRLHRDLGLNLAGAALALDLLDEIDTLYGRLQSQQHIQGGDADT